MADPTPTIISYVFHKAKSAGPFSVPAPAALANTSVVIRHKKNAAGGDEYRTVAYLVGPAAAATQITLAEATEWLVVIDLPGGIATSTTDMEAALGKSPVTPLDGGGTPPPPGPIHGGNMM